MKGFAIYRESDEAAVALGSVDRTKVAAVDVVAVLTTITGIAAMAAISFVYLVL